VKNGRSKETRRYHDLSTQNLSERYQTTHLAQSSGAQFYDPTRVTFSKLR